eukprot:CAMPEP_0202509974 /NCGR_PEP_ID=MMETSP1361-20130828/53051_1 /ASSEMBLY_ACC=CAM_ASM_000849 /TAXON_ID=210615 /ORGANISM="Staurosira complex sp., Strain CCMP2646" /LENGTH=501 /DNA_ID=CAMNT_0049144215 /DNA_START=30 /DNA_END=1535 /DNA_ORIENTATION=+
MIRMKFALLLLATTTASLAFEAANTLVASSPFELYLQPTFTELDVEAQSIAAQVVGNVLAMASSNIVDVDVVIQNLVYHPRRQRRLNSNTNLNLPSTTLTFAVLGTFPQEENGQRDYLNTLIRDMFSTNEGRSELLQGLKSSHDRFKDLINIRVFSVGPVAASTESSDGRGFRSLSPVDIVLVVVSICVLLGVAYMVIMSHRATQREHRRVLRVLSNHEAAADALRELEREENASISSRLQLLKNGMRRSTSMTIAPLDKPAEEEKATDNEEAPSPTSEETKEKPQEEVEQVPSIPTQPSSSSYHSATAEIVASSQDIQSIHSMRSEGIVSDKDVIPSPTSSSDEDDDTNYSESASGYSSGISSAHFSSSRWFQGSRANNPAPTPSEDTFDVFAIDVEKYNDKLLLDDGSKTSATEHFLEEWVKAIQVVPGEKNSVTTPESTDSADSTGSASTPDCASVQSGSSEEKDDKKETESVTHSTAPEMSETVEGSIEASTRKVQA